jgi:hypothetical protein
MIMMSNSDEVWEELPAEEQDRIMRHHGEVIDDLRRQKKFINSMRLRPAREAKTFRLLPGGISQVIDGPFCETREAIGGYYLIEAASIDEAVEWARRLRFMPGSNEVREIWED